MEVTDAKQVRAAVSNYYGKELGGTSDLKTSTCLTSGETTTEVKKLLRNVHPNVLARFYGCGSPVPPLLSGLTTLDLGCGTGRDTYVLSQLVGRGGTAIGVDMTPEQLSVAQETEAWHAAKFGFDKANTKFVHGDISDLHAAGISDASVDVVVSNCVLNLAADKLAVFKEIARVLKPGGELYFSDVYADRRIPSELQRDKVMWGECLSGALYRGDFARIMRSVGFETWWVVTSRRINIEDPTIAKATSGIAFYSETVRACKVEGLEDAPEDYGQFATYNGGIPGHPHAFPMGLDCVFITDQRTPVDGNTALILAASRYRAVFKVSAKLAHRGPFGRAGGSGGAGPYAAPDASEDSGGSSACCPPPRAASSEASSCCAPSTSSTSKCC